MSPVFAANIAGYAVLGLAGCGAVYGVLATFALWAFRRRPAPAPLGAPSITVLRPLHGDEPELYENLASVRAQGYAGRVQTLLALQRPGDPALAVAQRLQRDWPGEDISVATNPAMHGANRKISNLINIAQRASGEVILIADSDVCFPAGSFNAIVAALEDPGVGLVYCLYRGRPTGSLWSRLAALDINTRFAASVVVGQALGAHPCLGPAMALRAEVLARIGGLERLADFLADDYELGRAVRKAGHRVACPRILIDHVFPERSLEEVFTHELRWSRTVRLVQPAGYFGSVIVHFLALGLIGAALTGFHPLALAVLAGLALVRLVQADILSRLMAADRRTLWLVPARDLLSFAVFVVAAFGNRIEWRGARASIARDGSMSAT